MKYRMRDLENFVSAASCSSLGEAARRLDISQPSLTESIQRLEVDLGASVFYRSRSGIQLTPRGRLFLAKVQTLMANIEELDIERTSAKVFGGQILRIGCHATVASYTLPKAFAQLQKQAPDYQVDLIHDFSREIQMKVQKGILDIGIVINPVRVPDLVIVKLGTDIVKLWKAPDASNLETLIYDPGIIQSQVILKKWKLAPKKTIETHSLDLICRLTAKGLGYGIIPGRAVELSGEKLQAQNQLPSFEDELALVYRPEFGMALAEKITLQAIRSIF